jgi:hypothetical protein
MSDRLALFLGLRADYQVPKALEDVCRPRKAEAHQDAAKGNATTYEPGSIKAALLRQADSRNHTGENPDSC